MNKNRNTASIVRTVILSIMALISLILIILIIPFSVQSTMDSVKPSEDASGGEIIGSGVASIALSLVIILYYILAGFEVIMGIVGIIIGVVNRKAENKKLRYYNYVLLGLMAFTLIASIVKIILWRCGY